MNEKREQLWYAYVDGELSVTEMADFEKSLSVEDRERLAAELRFENGLSERLCENATCPEAVWERTKALLQKSSTTHDNVVPMPTPDESSSRRSWFWGAATVVAAACVALVVMNTPYSLNDAETQVVILAAETVDELAEQSEIEGAPGALSQYLTDHHIDLGLNDADKIPMAHFHYNIEVLGARENFIGNDPVVEMFFSCCDAPVKVIMAKRDSTAARYIGQAAGRGSTQIQATRIINHDYLAAVVGTHPAHGLLEIFAGQHP